MPGSIPFLYQDFHGGLNTKDAPYLLTDNEARDLANVQGTTAGAIVKRGGLVTFAQPSATLNSMAPVENTGSPFLIAAGGNALISVSASGGINTLASGITNNRWEFVSASPVSGQGPVYGMNGTDTPRQWTGSGVAANWTSTAGAVAVPNGKYCMLFNNRVLVAGVAGNPSRVYWSAIANPTVWDPAQNTGAGFIDLDPNDGLPITAIGSVGPYVLVAKARKMWILYDIDNALARVLSYNVGCISHRSIAVGPEGTYFLAEDRGVYLTNGSKLTPISDKIQPTIDAIQPGQKQFAAGAYFNGHYYLSVCMNPQTTTVTPGVFGASDGSKFGAADGTLFGDSAAGTQNDTTLDFDATLDSWWKHSFGSAQFAVWHPSGTAQLFSAKATAAIVDECFVPGVTQDNGQLFTWRWAGPWQSPTFYRRRRFPTPYFRKRLRQFRMDGAGTVDFSLAKDFVGAETLIRADALNESSVVSGDTFGGVGLWGIDGVFGDSTTITRGRVYTLGVANAFSVVFSATSPTEDTVTSYTLMVTDRKDLVVT